MYEGIIGLLGIGMMVSILVILAPKMTIKLVVFVIGVLVISLLTNTNPFITTAVILIEIVLSEIVSSLFR